MRTAGQDVPAVGAAEAVGIGSASRARRCPGWDSICLRTAMRCQALGRAASRRTAGFLLRLHQ